MPFERSSCYLLAVCVFAGTIRRWSRKRRFTFVRETKRYIAGIFKAVAVLSVAARWMFKAWLLEVS